MLNTFFTASLLFFLSFACAVFAQEGGPPMLTDDARVADYKEWELNTSLLLSFHETVEIAAPHLDLNYGLLPNLQLKFEAPLMVEIKEGQTHIGDVIAGVKYRFMEEENAWVSMATFPEYVVHGDKGFLLPVFVEKTHGKYLTGIGIGHFFSEKDLNRTEIGALVGYKPNQTLDLMVEYFYVKHHFGSRGVNGFVNAGLRQELTQHFVLLTSFGTQLVTPAGSQRERFISFVGLRSLF